jgi:amino acid transporter
MTPLPAHPSPIPPPPTLRRALGLPLLVLYGLGTTIGAGIYVLIGKVVERAGVHAPLAFLAAALLAALTAFSYAEMSARFPKSAGAALYVERGLGSGRVSLAVGLLVALSGIISAAAIAVGASGYIREFVAMPRETAIIGFTLGLGALAAWGIAQSVTVAAAVTLAEIAGLALVIWAGVGAPNVTGFSAVDLVPPLAIAPWSGILGGTMLAFYAFLGFEDMVTIAEEVKGAPRTLPAGILATLAITTALYGAVAVVAVLAVPADVLATSEAPLAVLFQEAGGGSPHVIGVIGMFAVLNGALIQIIMASRMLYGLADQKLLPAILARVNPRTRTPLVATALATISVLLLAVYFPIEELAETTSLAVLAVFALVNLALLCLKWTGRAAPAAFTVPAAVPAAGFVATLAVITLDLAGRLAS